MIALLQLRRKEPLLARPFKVPLYPFFPVTSLVIAVISFVAMTILNIKLSAIYFLLIAICYLAFKLNNNRITKLKKVFEQSA
jgi:ethanolamine permease